MKQSKFDKMVDELIELCFTVDTGNYYSDRNIEFDHMLETITKYIEIEED